MSTFQDAFQKHTSKLSEGPGVGLPRRHVFFTLDHEACLPGVFAADMTIELVSLTVAAELRASRGSGMEMASLFELSVKLAFEALHSVDGQVLGPAEKEWFWEAISQSGRQVVVQQYRNLIGDREEAQKKAEATLRIEG